MNDDHAAELAGLRAERDAAVYVPGVWKCPKCAFELTKSNLYFKSGTIGPNLDKPEACPNDGEMMQRVTWQECSQSNYKFAQKLLDERDALRAQLTAANAHMDKLREHRNDLDAACHELEGKLRESEAARGEALRHLVVVLPMAKGYAAAHPVGNNQQMCNDAHDLARRRAEGVGE